MPSTTELLFICGGGHSGSTLLDLLLGEHPEIVSVGEVSTLNNYLENAERICSCLQSARDCPFWQAAMSEFDDGRIAAIDTEGNTGDESIAAARTVALSRATPLDMRREHAVSLSMKAQYLLAGAYFAMTSHDQHDRAVLRRVAPDILERMVNVHRLFDAIRHRCERSVVLDSSKHAYRFRLLRALRPDSVRCLFLVRDGRARTFSDISRDGVDATSASRKWVQVNRRTRRLIASLPATHRLAVTYEGLCREPEATLRRICAFAGLDYAERMLDMQFENMHNIGGNRARFGSIGAIREDTRWRELMKPSDLETFERIGGPLNRALLGKHYRA